VRPSSNGDANGAKIILGIFIGGPLLLVVVVAAISFGAIGANIALRSGASRAPTDATEHANQDAARFRKAFAQVKTGNARTGRGGMTINQVVALLGKPHPNDISVAQTNDKEDTTYTYPFRQARGAPVWIVDFTNGRATVKSAL
jgi:hypothetical protein